MELEVKTTIRIGIDVRTIHQGGGCATYLQYLIPELVRQCPDTNFHLFTNSTSQDGLESIMDLPRTTIHRVRVPKAFLVLYDWLLVPLRARKLKLNLFHGPKSATSPLYRFFHIPTVTTIHDIIPLTYPDTERLLNRLYWSVQIPLAYRCSDSVITISAYARQQLEERYSKRSNIFVVYHGADHAQADLSEVAKLWPEVQKQFHIRKPYILYFGTIQPRKRVLELITAYWNDPELRKQYDCVIGGQWGWLYEDVKAFIKQNNAQEYIHCTGKVSDAVRSTLYVHASAFAYLSRDEGFGFPLLEAMAARVPVLTANQSCLPEIVGGAGLCVNADQESEIRTGLHYILDNAQLANALRVAGESRCAEFTWARCAEQTIAVYRGLLE